jgi:hypothetical protein
MGGEDDATTTSDARLEWMSQWVLSTTKLKDDKWKKMLAVDDMRLAAVALIFMQLLTR